MDIPKLSKIDPNRAIDFKTATSWGIKDPQRFFALLNEAAKLVSPAVYLGDNLFTWARNNSLFEDAAFRQAWESNIKNDADRAIAWRRYVLACAACHCAQLPGDFVECGVYWGSGIKTVTDYLGGQAFPRTFWGYDTFDSNPVAGHSFADQKEGFFSQVQARFAGYGQVKLVKGMLPGTFDRECPAAVSYLHIDLNDAAAEVAVLDRLFDKVLPGGMVILDDYEWAGIYRAQKMAEDDWFQRQNYRVMPLPTGQGLVFKR